MLIPHKVKNKGKYISFHYLRGWKARKIRKVQEISPQITIYGAKMIINENCPCKRKKCERHGKCDECRKHHAESERQRPVYCEKKKKE